MISVTYFIPKENLKNLSTNLKRLATRSKKKNLQGFTYEIHENRPRDIKKIERDALGFRQMEVYYRYIPVTIEGQTPKYEGWTFAATLEHLDNGQNVLRTLEEVPEEYKNVTKKCDHCQKNRDRRDTYLVRHEDGTYKQVGKNCMKDFLGHESPEFLIEQAKLLGSLVGLMEEPPEDNGKRTPVGVDIEEFLFLAAEVILKEKGYSKGTGQIAWRLMFDGEFRKEWTKEHGTDLHPDSGELAYNAREWMKNLNPGQNQYLYNLSVLSQQDEVKARNKNLLASGIYAYQKEKAILEENKEAAQTSEHVGEIKKRYNFNVLVKDVREVGDEFSPCRLIKFVDDSGNELVWFTGFGTEDFQVGEKATIRATVKKHQEFRGVKNTVVNRVSKVQGEKAHAV